MSFYGMAASGSLRSALFPQKDIPCTTPFWDWLVAVGPIAAGCRSHGKRVRPLVLLPREPQNLWERLPAAIEHATMMGGACVRGKPLRE